MFEVMYEMTYLFSGKIKCMNCGQNFRGKKFRNTIGYVCSGNSNYGNEYCERFMIKESELTDIIKKHFELDEFNIEDIKSIEVKGKKVTIYYSDNSKSTISGKQYTV